jgi:hypothetical protein
VAHKAWLAERDGKEEDEKHTRSAKRRKRGANKAAAAESAKDGG